MAEALEMLTTLTVVGATALLATAPARRRLGLATGRVRSAGPRPPEDEDDVELTCRLAREYPSPEREARVVRLLRLPVVPGVVFRTLGEIGTAQSVAPLSRFSGPNASLARHALRRIRTRLEPHRGRLERVVGGELSL
jgi:hypothetical protein